MAAVSQMQDNGRYQADGTTHTLIYKLYSDGKVVAVTLRETRDGKSCFTGGKRKHNLGGALLDAESREAFADEWAKMYRVQDFDRLNPFQLEKLRECEK